MKFYTFLVIITTFCSLLSKVYSLTNVTNSYSFVLSCGATNNATDADGRIWSPDSTYFPSSSGNSITSKAKYQDPSLISDIPYMTARIFKNQTTYSFPVSPKSRHWIRLHFYPSSYDNFNCSNSFFSVNIAGFTLLNNFSASITAQALTQAYIIREFTLVPLQTATLNITFTPSSAYNDSFAFINGIEIVSMPEIFEPAPMVGFSDQTTETQASSMQTMFRLNVGGQYIPANNDSGLGRIWYDDAPYLFGASFGITSAANNSMKISYPSNLPNYIAPEDVYRTARSMGPNPDVNRNYNLTWIFQVDTNFTYLVRLHFCDFQMKRMNQRVFKIFLNNQTALEEADVIAWSSAQNVPAYKDFVIYQTGDDEMWVALHPTDETKAEFYDAILNGLEIFKINDTTGNLAGPNPVPSPPLAATDTDSQSKPAFASNKTSKKGIIVGSVAGMTAGLSIVVVVLTFVKRRKNINNGGNKSSRGGWLPIYSSRSTETRTTISGKSSGSSHISNIGGGLCRYFTLAEIKQGTKNFDESRVIGVGGFGKVYRGEIDGGTTVAIKRANPSSEQGLHEFQTEIELLSKLRHRHLVSLIGACEENDEMILVYDYMANGTLREHLYKHNKPPLSWKQRLEICIGAARGLHYLHTGARYTIIHRDVKTTNILVDDKWVAKVSDFGLSKTGPNLQQTHVSTMVKGSFGYLDPEYFRRQQLTEKSDVYSFGVVLFEVLSGRPALNASLPKEQVSLADWALHCHRKNTTKELMDPHIKGEIIQECLKQFIDTAVSCLSDHGTDRPSMGSVLWNLEYCLQLQSDPDEPKMVAEQKANDAYAMHTELLTVAKEGMTDHEASAMEVERRHWKPQECSGGEREVAVEEEEDPFLQFIEYAKSVLSPDGNGSGDDPKGPSWRWIASRILKTCIAYSSGVTSAILLSDLFQAWNELNKSGAPKKQSECIFQLKKKHKRAKLPSTVTIDSIYEKKFLSLNSVIEAVIIDTYILPGTNIYMLHLGDFWSSNTIDLYLHRRFYSLADQKNGILKKGREVFLTGCRLRTATGGSGHARLLPTEYLVILLDEDQNDDAMLLLAQFCEDNFSAISLSDVNRGVSYSLRGGIKSITSLEVQGKYGSLQRKQIDLVDHEGVSSKFLLWGEQVLLANLFSVGSTLALDRPFISSSTDCAVETSQECCLEYGTATQLYLVPFVQNEEQVSLALTQNHNKGPKLSRALDPSQGLVVSQVFLPCDSQGSIDFSDYPFRSFVVDLREKMTGISLYGIVSDITSTQEPVLSVKIQDVTGAVWARLHFARSWSLGRLGLGHTIYISGLMCSVGTGKSLELRWVENDVGASFINISCLPALLNSSCLHKLSCLSDLSAEPTGTRVCRVWLDQIEHCHVTVRLSHTSCGYFLDDGSSEDLKCNFCQRKCNAELAQNFHLKITLADESGKLFAWCTGQTAVELLQITPDEFCELPEEEQIMYPSSLEHETFKVALVSCRKKVEGLVDQDHDTIAWEITRAMKCE